MNLNKYIRTGDDQAVEIIARLFDGVEGRVLKEALEKRAAELSAELVNSPQVVDSGDIGADWRVLVGRMREVKFVGDLVEDAKARLRRQ